MIPLVPKLPSGSRVLYNALYPTKEPSFLTDDLFLAELSGGIFVDVGWFPESDPDGAYEVIFHRGNFEERIAPPFESVDLAQVVEYIERMAA